LRHHIEAALEHDLGLTTIEDVEQALADRRMLFWPGDNSAVVTELTHYPHGQILHVFLAGGNKEELYNMLDSIEEFARTLDCTHVTLAGRLGWMREQPLKDRNYKTAHVVMAKEL